MAKRSRLELTRDSSRWLQIAPHKKLHFPDGVEQELAEITESAEEKSFAAERRGKEWILEWHGRRDGSDKGCRERFGMGDPLIGSPGCTSVPNPISIGDYGGFRVYQTRTEAVPSRTTLMVD